MNIYTYVSSIYFLIYSTNSSGKLVLLQKRSHFYFCMGCFHSEKSQILKELWYADGSLSWQASLAIVAHYLFAVADCSRLRLGSLTFLHLCVLQSTVAGEKANGVDKFQIVTSGGQISWLVVQYVISDKKDD